MNKYLIDHPRFTLGLDLRSWALPVSVMWGPYDLQVRVLCFDFGFYSGEVF